MSILGNILWIVIGGGIFIFIEYLFGGLILCLTIVGIPFGLQCLKLSYLALVPFGKSVVHGSWSYSFLGIIMNIVWIVSAGLAIAVTHLLFALLAAITIIGIPFARQHVKLAALALTPFGTQVR